MGWPKRFLGVMTTVIGLSIHAENCGWCDQPKVLVVLGAAGEPQYGEIFQECGNRWQNAFRGMNVKLLQDRTADADGNAEGEPQEAPHNTPAELDSPSSHRDQILDWISNSDQIDTAPDSEGPPEDWRLQDTRWLVLIGHGTTDRLGSKFNLVGPDISAKDLANALQASKKQWVIVNCSSASGPFVAELSGPNRIIVTATKSGAEQNYSRFADYMSKSLTDPSSDLDHDSQISVLEAFLAASSGVAKFYQDEGRLASEQALLDDNGDKRGTPALFFRGLRAVKAPKDGLKLDGESARRLIITQLGDTPAVTPEIETQLREIELKIELLKQERPSLGEAEYTNRLETLLLQMAALLLPE